MISKLANMQAAIRHVNNMTEEIKVKMKECDVKAVPTTIIDGKIKVVSVPDVPWICGDDLYKKIKGNIHYKDNNVFFLVVTPRQ